MSAAKILEGMLNAQGKSFGIVVSRFNSLVTRELLRGAQDCLLRHGVQEKDITIAWVPGAGEIPQALKRLADSKKFDALIALGCVIRGGTPHFDQVVALVTRGVGEIALQGNAPVAFGVLTTENLEQALERAGAKAGNKGWDAALAAVEMSSLWEKLP
ncbi:MAG TPA: 6,7-dimethyl-8-ribityllumazine synthase [Fibrobacteres bacterium]|jgi:6,7-dimethyl-8-ribityllumazine synthase|nr:6,7-dimethyl-8-ribityllumazine synthase [Fibrobacterota bacterium]